VCVKIWKGHAKAAVPNYYKIVAKIPMPCAVHKSLIILMSSAIATLVSKPVTNGEEIFPSALCEDT
jgi:hypothetical protein